MDAVDTLYANTRNNPIEDMESHLPLRIRRYELRDDAVAAGQWRGGIGSVREFEFLADGGFSIDVFRLFAIEPTIIFYAVGNVQDMREMVEGADRGTIRTHVDSTGPLSDIDAIF